jgi:hypothetical protein
LRIHPVHIGLSLHIHRPIEIVFPLLASKTILPETDREVVFFHLFNSLATKELYSVFKPVDAILSAMLGE